MQGPEQPPLSERSSAVTGRPAPLPADGDPPTVLTGVGGSSARRAAAAAQSQRPIPLPVAGDRIDSFELEEAIGVGGMGAVFRAYDTRLDRQIALKILPPEQANDPEVVKRFYQEGRAAAQLDHENIARVYTIGHDGQFHYIAFEFIAGITIRQRVERDGSLPISEAVNYTLQIAAALVHASERGVVHRDIKPSNIIITPQGRAKLVDMGLARRFERGSDTGLTQSGMTLGTFDYISPEQARDPRDVDVRSDLYSLGCTLFHMLAGRPPFPDGTVLQKLIQHQEEPAPDVRSINPDIPPDLAAIVVKLMAKDRDRRYQTPEQLVRDLLILAGALGLRSVSPEGLIWMSASHAPTWERHLVWGVPVLGFLIVLAVVAWWGQEPAAPALPPGPAPGVAVAPIAPAPARAGGNPEPAPPGKPATHEPVAAAPSVPREITVDSREDLFQALAKAPPRATVILADDGPYIIQGKARLSGLDVTLKAAWGVRPLIIPPVQARAGNKDALAALDLVDGRVTLEGLEFLLEPGERDDLVSIRAENTELTLRRCVFRREGARSKRSRMAAVQLRFTANQADAARPPAVAIESCHFDSGQTGILATGPAEILVRDCSMAAANPAIWLENPKAAGLVPVDLRVVHSSILAGEGPVFRFDGTEPRVWAEDTVFAAARDPRATLIVIDNAARLDWRGRANLFGRVGIYLQSGESSSARGTIRDPIAWTESLATVRETGSMHTDQLVWKEPDPLAAIDPDDPTVAFRLSPAGVRVPPVGVRHGPYGSLAPSGIALADAGTGPKRSAQAPEKTVTNAATTPAPEPNDPAPAPMPMGPPESAGSEPLPSRVAELPAMPPTPPNDATPRDDARTDGTRTPAKAQAPAAGRQDAAKTERSAPTELVGPTRAADPAVDVAVMQTAEQFLNALTQPGARNGLIHVAANADWELPGIALRGPGRWTVRAEPAANRNVRPRIRFRPAAGEPKSPGSWMAWIDLRSGSVQLEGIDVVLTQANAPRQGRWAAFSIGAGADLSLSSCTVTIEGDQVASAAVAVASGEPSDDPPRGAASAATVRLSDSLIRAGGDLVEVAPGKRLELDINDAVVSTRGALVHAHGAPRGQVPEPIRLKLALRQVTARAGGGIVQLESAQGEPDLPVAEVNARDSIFATTPQGDPLFRVDGQDALALLRDRIVWEGHGVAYHQINTYRRDQSAQVGTVPSLYDRPSWSVAVGSREDSPVHGDVRFVREWDNARPAWTLRIDDVKLADDSPAASAGADPLSIPNPPANEP
jgi:serine/threonine-protein kinase